MLSNDIMDYHIVSQGKTVIPGVDDGEEMNITDVSPGYDGWLSVVCAYFQVECIYCHTLLLYYYKIILFSSIACCFLGLNMYDTYKYLNGGS